MTPYASVEPFYQSQYGKWSETAIYAGCIFPIRKHFQLDPYYEHQNQTGKTTESATEPVWHGAECLLLDWNLK